MSSSCALETVRRIGKYLNASVGTLTYTSDKIVTTVINKENVDGFASVIVKLLQSAKYEQSSLKTLLIYQWLEYISPYVDQLNNNAALARTLLSELNNTLEVRSYLVGHELTIADVIIYHIIYDTLAKYTITERENIPHVCRWARHLQSNEKLRCGRDSLKLQAINLPRTGTH